MSVIGGPDEIDKATSKAMRQRGERLARVFRECGGLASSWACEQVGYEVERIYDAELRADEIDVYVKRRKAGPSVKECRQIERSAGHLKRARTP